MRKEQVTEQLQHLGFPPEDIDVHFRTVRVVADCKTILDARCAGRDGDLEDQIEAAWALDGVEHKFLFGLPSLALEFLVQAHEPRDQGATDPADILLLADL